MYTFSLSWSSSFSDSSEDEEEVSSLFSSVWKGMPGENTSGVFGELNTGCEPSLMDE